MRLIALQSALGGMALAAAGYVPPAGGALAQEIIDIFATTNALRAGLPARGLTDF